MNRAVSGAGASWRVRLPPPEQKRIKNYRNMETIEKCRCVRCKNKHLYSERIPIERKRVGVTLCCPKCGCGSYNDITEREKLYCTGYPGIDICPKSKECQLVVNLKRDNPDQLDKRRVYHYTKTELKNCKYFKPIEI
jgi:hypothetical protein